MENSPRITPQNNSNPEIINLRELILKYLRKWYWFAISVTICLIAGFIYLKTTNTQYKVQSTILLRQDKGSSPLSEMALLQSMGLSGTSKEVEDEIQVLTSKTILKNLIQELGVENEIFVKEGLRYVDTYPNHPVVATLPSGFNELIKGTVQLTVSKSKKGYKIKYKGLNHSETYKVKKLNEPLKTPDGIIILNKGENFENEGTYRLKFHPIRNITEAYAQRISIGAVNKKSNAISISTISDNTVKAADILNKLVELYNLDAVIDKNMIASNTKQFVDERLELIQKELLEVEINVENYKRSNNLTDISSEAEIFLKSSSEYNKKLAEIETQLNLTSYIESHVKDPKNQYSLVPANLGIEDKSLLELIKVYNEALLERMKLLRTVNTENPVITQLEMQLKTLRMSIVTSIESVKDGLKIAKNDVLGKESQFTRKIKEVPTQERQYIEIKRQQEIKQNLYLFLLEKREENALSLASTTPSAKTVDAAYTSTTPESPKVMIIFALMLVIGMLIPVAIIYVMDLFNNKISDKKEFVKAIKAPFLGTIGINKDAERIVVREGNTTPIAEMFRMVRTNIQFMLGGVKSPVILITSSVGGEGKSFTAMNLAMSFALTNKKVILVGLDIRKPMLGEYMHISKSNGVTMYISDPTHSVDDVIIPSGIHKSLDVIPAGPIPPNPAELLMNSRLDDLIAELRNRYDYVIIDSAPVGVVSDTYLLNRFLDSAVYVSRQHYTPKAVTELINEIHDHQKLKNIGLVLNGVDEATGYGYGYGYGYGHARESKKFK